MEENPEAGGGGAKENQAHAKRGDHERDGDGAGDGGALGGAGGGGVELASDKAVEGHGEGAGEDHAGKDEAEQQGFVGEGANLKVFLPEGPEGGDEGEGECEYGVGELDEVEEGGDLANFRRGGWRGRREGRW